MLTTSEYRFIDFALYYVQQNVKMQEKIICNVIENNPLFLKCYRSCKQLQYADSDGLLVI